MMAQWLKVLVVLSEEEPGLSPSTHKAANNLWKLQFQVI